MLTQADVKTADEIFKVVRNGATSLSVLTEFLKGKGLTSSAGSWDAMWKDRILPHLQSGELTLDQLRNFLSGVEESGKQHVFLYRCVPARAQMMLGEARFISAATIKGVEKVISTPVDLAMPDTPQITEIRIKKNNLGVSEIAIKMVETRLKRRYLGEKTDGAGIITKTYATEPRRAVNMAILSSEGLLQIRIASQDNSSQYDEPVRQFLNAINPLFLKDEFSPILLSKAKNRIWNDRAALSNEIRYSNSTAANQFGNRISISAATAEENLTDDAGSDSALTSFLSSSGHITGSNVYFKIPQSDPPREIHVLLSGELNEFAIPVACTAAEFEYVRTKIASLNQ